MLTGYQIENKEGHVLDRVEEGVLDCINEIFCIDKVPFYMNVVVLSISPKIQERELN